MERSVGSRLWTVLSALIKYLDFIQNRIGHQPWVCVRKLMPSCVVTANSGIHIARESSREDSYLTLLPSLSAWHHHCSMINERKALNWCPIPWWILKKDHNQLVSHTVNSRFPNIRIFLNTWKGDWRLKYSSWFFRGYKQPLATRSF